MVVSWCKSVQYTTTVTTSSKLMAVDKVLPSQALFWEMAVMRSGRIGRGNLVII